MTDRPLRGIRVVDAVGGPLAAITRYLAHLGARVDRVVHYAVGDAAEDRAANSGKTLHNGLSAPDISALANRAHIVVADAAAGVELAALRNANPALVTMFVSDFGTGNALSDWQGTGPILHALSAELSRSGIRGREPLLPPGDLAYQCSAAQGAFALLGALYRALATGQGAHFDFSALDGAVQALDPGFGISGSATLGKPAGLLVRDRPRVGFQYPIFPCADGYIRICLLAKRQWRGMFTWLGEPEQFASPEFDKTANRYKSPDLLPYIARFFKDRNRADLEREGQAHGVPISGLMTLEEFVVSDHAAARDAVVTMPDGVKLPNGMQTIDGARMGPADCVDDFDFPTVPLHQQATSPFAGLKVLDLGVIVVGAEQARLLGDYGADVIKVESQAFPDGNRQSYLDFGMSVSFAAGHRNKRSLGIDLRCDEGRALFLELVQQADVLCSNFKPGTMEKLGLGADVLRNANPRLVVSESSAFGDSGPWSNRMGYGPLVRAATGLTLAWRYPDLADGFSDSITIYPDHVAGRVCAMGAVALLIRRLRTGEGGVSRVAQSEVMLGHFAAQVARGAPRGEVGAEPDWPWGVFPAKGDDEWCAITVRSDDDWHALCATIGYGEGTVMMGAAARLAAKEQISSRITAWLAQHDPMSAAQMLQNMGVPAAPMLRIGDLPDFVYYKDRQFYRVEGHPWLKEQVFADRFTALSADIPPPGLQPAPLVGEQTEDVIAEWLGKTTDEIAVLCEARVLEPLSSITRQQAEDYMNEGAPAQNSNLQTVEK